MDDQTWFLLFGGSSADGAGPGVYEGRTVDPKVAIAHFKKVSADPYSTGYVQIVTDNILVRAFYESDITYACRGNV